MNFTDDEDELDEREFPDESDMDSTDEEATPTVLCRRCGREVYDEAAVCPYCGAATNGARNRKPMWIILVAVACIAGMIAYFVL